jgi:hypothetical protein
MTVQQFSDDVVLAALDRAARHSNADREIAGSGTITLHLAISTRSGAWRLVRRQLDALVSAGLVEYARYAGMPAWGLTQAGRVRLRTIDVVLPESPQHQQWRQSREIAEQEMGRFRAGLADALRDGLASVESGAPARSDVWIGLRKRVGREAERVAGAAHCLGEWPEPDDATAEAATTDEMLLRRVVLEYARTLTVAGMVMRWSIDIEADAVMIVLTPVSTVDREALEDATLEVERVFDEQVAAGASASGNFQTGCIEVDIVLDAITVTDISRKLWSLEPSDP